jgi:3',5'-cyclic-AMP phosphodiesterase
MKILLLGDLHLVPEGELVRGQDTNAAFERGWREMASIIASADLIVVNGDISQNACTEGYRRFRRAINEISSKLLITVGNQDSRDQLRDELGTNYLCSTGHAQSARHATASVILLDTLIPGRAEGAICAVRIAWLSEQLKLAEKRPVIAIMHHPPANLGVAALDEVALLEGRSKLLEVLSKHSAPVTIFASHHHISATSSIGNMAFHVCPAFAGPPAKFGLWDQAPVFGPGANGACALTVSRNGLVEVRFLTHSSL